VSGLDLTLDPERQPRRFEVINGAGGRRHWSLDDKARIHERLLEKLKASPKLFADETTAPVLDPGRGKTKTGQLWAYARDDRPWHPPRRRGRTVTGMPIWGCSENYDMGKH